MKKYFKDYNLVTESRENGISNQRAEYKGKYYICQLNKVETVKNKLYLFTLALCSGAVLIAVGLLNTSGSKIFYVALPYVGMFLPAVFSLLGIVRLITEGNRLEFVAYDKSRNRMYRSSITQIILSSLTIIGDICYFSIKENIMNQQREIIFLIGIICVLLFNILLFIILKKVIYKVEESVM
jgi:hypothetical protein